MTDQSHHHSSDEDLLAGAIPIPPEESESDEDELKPIEFDDSDDSTDDDDNHASMIKTIGKKEHKTSRWKRQPVSTGQGASHVRTFIAKLRMDAIEHIDEQINEWLDEHPDYEVKFVSTSVGPLIGKTTENAIFVNVWV